MSTEEAKSYLNESNEFVIDGQILKKEAPYLSDVNKTVDTAANELVNITVEDLKKIRGNLRCLNIKSKI